MRRIDAESAFGIYPALHYRLDPEGIRAAFTLDLTTNFGNHHQILMVVTRSYPFRPPFLYLLTNIRGPHKIVHIYTVDGRLCIFEKLERDWDPKECDLVTAIGWGAT
ncbi:MAG TPA: hypothetical protein VMG82_29235 [Candidatus Sulfotelmatobacter sp.]|nr:hypothetical protein [Candidatus Sulfotelmatobacter sp.]